MTHADIIGLWPTSTMLDRLLHASDGLARQWRYRGRIPPRWWPQIARLPRARRNGVTVEVLERGYSRTN